MKRGYLLLILLALLSGCAVGPDYKRPAVKLPENFRAAPAEATAASLADAPWWDVYRDDTLKYLIRVALEKNYDLRVAATRVEQARAVVAEAQSMFLPALDYDGLGSTGRNEQYGRAVRNRGRRTTEAISSVSAAWEVDMWGRIRRLNEADQAQFFATEEARRGVALSLLSEVATAYFQLLELDAELEIARRTADSFQASLKIFRQRLNGGVASKLETSRAEAALAATAATIPGLERQIAATENQISILLGRAPAAIPRSTTLLEQTMPPEVPAGLPSALLEHRPDIRQAEQLLRAANAEIGVAIAEFLPHIELTGTRGRMSPDFLTLNGATQTWATTGDVSGPLFRGGALVAGYKGAKAARQQARLQYRQTILNALQEVADALCARDKYEEMRVQLALSVVAYRESVKVSSQRYVAGRASYYEVLEAQQELFPAEIALARTQLNQLLAIVQLYKALGGGWPADEKIAVKPARDR